MAPAAEKEQADLRALMHRYRNRPRSLADACRVRPLRPPKHSRWIPISHYRRRGNKVIPVLTPEWGVRTSGSLAERRFGCPACARPALPASQRV